MQDQRYTREIQVTHGSYSFFHTCQFGQVTKTFTSPNFNLKKSTLKVEYTQLENLLTTLITKIKSFNIKH